MIDDRQLLRLSRNLISGLSALLAIWSLLGGLQYAAAWFQYTGGRAGPGFPSWTFAALAVAHLFLGVLLFSRRNWLARKLIQPVRADTCPACDYPINVKAARCSECGLWLTQEPSVGSRTQEAAED